MIDQSFSWWSFQNNYDADKLLAGAKSIGYKAVEMVGSENFARVLGHGLAIATESAHASLEVGLNDPREHERIEHEIRAKIDEAVEFKIPALIVFSGNRREGRSEDEGIRNTAAGLARVARAAEEAGITLVLELLNSKVDHRGYQADHTSWGVEACRRVDSPAVKLLYDIYHMQIMEGDLIRTIESNHEFIGHYHTAGNPGRHDLDSDQEIHYPAVVRAIAATGYTGYIGQEFIPKGDPLAALKAAYDICSAD